MRIRFIALVAAVVALAGLARGDASGEQALDNVAVLNSQVLYPQTYYIAGTATVVTTVHKPRFFNDRLYINRTGTGFLYRAQGVTTNSWLSEGTYTSLTTYGPSVTAVSVTNITAAAVTSNLVNLVFNGSTGSVTVVTGLTYTTNITTGVATGFARTTNTVTVLLQ